MTLAQKILAAHAGKKQVDPGEFLSVKVDLVFSNEQMTSMVIEQLDRLGTRRFFDPKRVLLIPDHMIPNSDIATATLAKNQERLAVAQGALYFEVGRGGIEHVLVPEQGLALPGDVILGADSHTVTHGAVGAFATGMGATDIAVAMATGQTWLQIPSTIRINYHGKLPKWVGGKDLILYTLSQLGMSGATYKAIEFGGEAVGELTMDGRFTMSNMVVEAGAKAGIFAVDGKTLEYVRPRAKREFKVYKADPDAQYERVIDFDVSNLEPQVSFPHLPSNARGISDVGEIPINQVYLGSCTNGRLSDLRLAAQIMKGRKVHPKVRCIVIPGTRQVYLDALKEGLIEIFTEADALVGPPTCGACCGAHMGVLAAEERAVSTTNRNFVGRMGHVTSEVYLAGPAVAAASAIAGRVAGPEE